MKTIEIIEVAPRDGLQNESHILPTAQKTELISRLAGCGMRRIEVTACVSAKRVPQMADYAEVLKTLPPTAARYMALTANMRGASVALAHNTITDIAVFTAASEAFNQHNINCSIDDSIRNFTPIVTTAKAQGRRVRGYISTAVICPFAGKISPQKVAEVAVQLVQIGCDEISLGDTIGAATPKTMRAMLRAVKSAVPTTPLAAHCHDTYGFALANIACAIEEDIHRIDCAVAGLGGCPFAPGAAGNAASEDVIYFLQKEGFDIDIDLDALIRTGQWICAQINRPYTAKVGMAKRS